MADRSVKVRLDADVTGFQAKMRTAAKAVEDFDKRATGWIDKNRTSINDLSNAALGLGAGLVAGAGLAAKAAMDWESAWAGVTKTVDGSDAELAALEAGLRDMAKTLPATHAEIAAVAEAAGQLGISTPNIESFTKTMIDLGESTNMSADEAATALARFVNITGTAESDIGRLGATVVGLGNSFATTESEIIALSMRLAGAGVQAGLSEGEIMGLASAMSSVGIEAEAGGSAMSLTMKRISKSVEEGGDSLDLFAQTAGMTADEFAEKWRSSPAEALNAFIDGLARTEQMGMSTNAVLTELGITGIRESDALLRLSSATGLAADAMAQGNEEFAAGSALIEEASKRYETAESRIAMARNTIVDAAIDLGGALAPSLAEAAEMVGFLATKFTELPDPVKSALGMGAGIAGMALLAVGGLGKAVVAANDLKLAMTSLGIATDTTSKKMKLLGVGSAVGVAIAALTLTLGHFVSKSAEARTNADLLVESFDDLTGAATAGTDELILDQLNDSLSKADWDKLKELGFTYEEVVNAIKEGGPALDELNDKIFANQTSLSNTQEMKGYEDSLKSLRGSANDAADAYELSREQLALTEDQMGSTGDQAEDTAAQQEILQAAVEETGVALDGVIADLQTFLDLLFETGLATMSARDAQAAYHESVDEVGETVDSLIEKHGGLGTALNDAKTDFDLTTEAGREANSAFQDVARSGMDVATSMAEASASQEDIQGHLRTTYDDLIAAAGQFGITGDAAEELAREVMGIPDGVEIDTWMDDEAERQARDTQNALNGIDRYIEIVTQYVTRGTRPPVGNRGAPVPIPTYATGGAVHGPGTGTSDSIHARLSNGEHVWTAREVAAAGGHSEVYRLRKAALAGVPAFAEGGPVLRPMEYSPRRIPQQSVAAGPSVSVSQTITGLDAYEVARHSRAEMQHVIGSHVPTFPR